MNPLISIIMPCRNAERFIGQAISSVLAQSIDPWELLIIDNGSTDDTRKVIATFTDPRIRCLSEPREGVSRARNAGMEAMRGDVYCFLDSDDVLPPNSLESRLSILESDSGTLFADGAIARMNEELTETLVIQRPVFEGWPLDALMRIDTSCFMGNTWMVRRTPETEPRFNEGMAHSEDLAFYMSMAHAGRYGHTSDIVLHYRTGHSSAMSKFKGYIDGYARLLEHAGSLPTVDTPHLRTLERRVRSIVFRSCMKRGVLLEAARAIIRIGRWRPMRR